MTTEQLNKSKTPVVKLDKRLEKFHGRTLFPEKLKEANNTLAKVGIPQIPTK